MRILAATGDAAAALHDLRPKPHTTIDVTAPKSHRRDGIRCHISPLPPQYRTLIDAIPVTTLERTYLDYAEQATPRQLAAALEAGRRRDILDFRKLRLVMSNSIGRRGVKPLRAAIAALADDPAVDPVAPGGPVPRSHPARRSLPTAG